MDTNPGHWLDALAGSHDGLAAKVAELDGGQLRGPSYCDEWTIAQVLSHLGSGAEIFTAILAAVVAGEAPPGSEAFPAVWDRWNAMTPEGQAEAFVAADGQLVETLEHLGDRLDGLEFTLFGGMRLDAVGFLGMRLNEHALHAWDVAVALDPAARVERDSVQLLIDRLPAAGWAGKAERAGADRPFSVAVQTDAPSRRFRIDVDEAVRLTEGGPGGDGAQRAEPAAPEDGAAALDLPAEALLRLVYGRLDPDHAPPTPPEAAPALGRLRQVFPGM